MSEDDKKICFAAIKLMERYGIMYHYQAEMYKARVEDDGGGWRRDDVPPYKRMNA